MELAEIEAVRLRLRSEHDQAMRDRARQIGGVPGVMIAGLMIALRDIYEAPKRDQGAVVVDLASQPHDVEREGMRFDAEELGGDAAVTISPLERRRPVVPRRARSRRWRR